MNSSPKIFVLKFREIIYTLILIFLAVLLIVCMILMFKGKNTSPEPSLQYESSSETYNPGVYTSSVSLGGNSADIEVIVGKDRINSIRFINLNEAVTASYPLVPSAFEHLVNQILTRQSLDQITCSTASRYTSQVLFSAIEQALSLAQTVE